MKPILFNTEMVRAILEDRKTVTRRAVKPKSKNACGFKVVTRKSDGAFMGVYDYDENEQMFENSQTPPCAAGDILYVRETWGCYQKDWQDAFYFMYRADYPEGATTYLHSDGVHICDLPKWKPSIHMPKEAARLFLRVKSVCLERLQDIDDKGAYMEGAGEPNTIYQLGARVCEFVKIWNSTIKPSQFNTYGWDANPFVWVIEFERIPCSSIEEAEQLEQVQQLHSQTSFDEDVIGCYKSNYMKAGRCEAAQSGWCKDLTKCQVLEKMEGKYGGNE